MTPISSDVQISQAALAQLDAVVPLFDAYRQFYKQPSDLAGAWQFLRERIEHAESVIFLASQNGRALGFTQLYPSFSSLSMKPLWVLNDLYVVPDARKQGVGAALLRRAQQFAIARQARGLSLATAVDNPAQRLYEQMGWVRDTQFYHYLWIAG